MSRILVVGAGSIGKRHIRNLLKLGAEVFVYRYRREAVGSDALPAGAIAVADLAQEIAGSCNAVVIANRTDLHVDVALAAAGHGKAIFLEKPISNSLRGVDELERLVAAGSLSVEVGFMLRFHPNLRWIKAHIDGGGIGEIQFVRAAVGQHLPDWRPGTDHRQSYSGRRESGGGVIFDLIHELDLVRWLCGEVQEVVAMSRYVPWLGIQTEAVAEIVFRLKNGILAQVHLDYVRPTYSRTLEIVGATGTLSWDYTSGTVLGALGSAPMAIMHRVPEHFERNDMFIEHMQHFLSRLAGRGADAEASLADGVAALRLALAAHLSAEQRRYARPAEIGPDYVAIGVAV